MEPPSLIRYIIPLLVLVHGIHCAGTPSTTKSPTTTTAFPGFRDPTFADIANKDNKDVTLNKLDVFHMDDKCGIAHFAYAKTNWYSSMTGPSTINMLNSTSSCPKATQTFVMVSDGAQFYKISLKNDGDKTPFNFELFQIPPLSGRPVSKGSVAVTWNDFQSTEKSNISSCFHDLGSLYCLRIRDNSNFNKNNRLVFHRFTKHGIDKTSFLVHSGVLNFPVKHDIDKGGQPQNVLYDVQSGDIIASFDKQAGIIANEYDVRSLYGLGDRGALFKAVFPLDKAIGVATHNGFQYFLVTKHENSTYGYTFYYITSNDKAHARRNGYAPTISGGDCHITPETLIKVLAIPWKRPITEMCLNSIDGPLCPNLFFKFVKKHVDPEASIHVDFKDESDTFQKLYNQMVIVSGEKMPTLGNVAHLVKKKTKVQHVLSWIASFASLIEIIQGESVPFKKSSAPKQLTKVIYSDENVERQYTALPYPHMCYIRENADAETWKKLERTCKFFYQKNPYLMVDDLRFTADNKTILMVDNKKLVFENREEIAKPLWITNSLDITASETYHFHLNCQIYAKEISINFLIFSKMAFIFFTKSRLVLKWDSLHSLIKNDNDKVISLHELLSQLPNAEIVRAQVRGINPQNAIQPIILPQLNNIKQLSLLFLREKILAPPLFDVLKKSLAPKAHIQLDFRELIEGMNVGEFKAQMKTLLDTWKPEIEKPTFKIMF